MRCISAASDTHRRFGKSAPLPLLYGAGGPSADREVEAVLLPQTVSGSMRRRKTRHETHLSAGLASAQVQPRTQPDQPNKEHLLLMVVCTTILVVLNALEPENRLLPSEGNQSRCRRRNSLPSPDCFCGPDMVRGRGTAAAVLGRRRPNLSSSTPYKYKVATATGLLCRAHLISHNLRSKTGFRVIVQ